MKNDGVYQARTDLTNFSDREEDRRLDGMGDEELVRIDEIITAGEAIYYEEIELTEESDNAPKSVDSVSSVSEYVQHRKRHQANRELSAQYEKYSLEELLAILQEPTLEEKTRKWLKDEIFFKVFFLLPYVVKKNYKIPSHLFNDAIQNMSLTVLVAIEKFDPTRGFKFISYLAGYLKAAMTRTFKDTNVVAVPTGRRKILREMQLSQGDATEEIFSYTGLEYDSNSAAGSPKINFEEIVHNKELLEWLEEALSEEAGLCSEDARLIILSYYGLFDTQPMPYREIAEIRKSRGCSSSLSRISQIHAKTLEKFRQFFLDRNIEEF